MPNEVPHAHQRPVVAVGTTAPRLLTLADTGRAAVVDALRQYDALPPDFPAYAHRVVLRDALRSCGLRADTIDAVAVARGFLS